MRKGSSAARTGATAARLTSPASATARAAPAVSKASTGVMPRAASEAGHCRRATGWLSAVFTVRRLAPAGAIRASRMGRQTSDTTVSRAASTSEAAGSTRPTTVACGGPEFVCPRSGGVAPLAISPGYYTTVAMNAAHDLSFAPTCPAGRWRNFSGVVDASLAEVPSVYTYATTTPEAPCDLCPAGKFKQLEGDSLDMCLDCDPDTMAGDPDRRVCACLRPPGGAPLGDREVLVFNYTRATNAAVCSVANETAAMEILAAAALVCGGAANERKKGCFDVTSRLGRSHKSQVTWGSRTTQPPYERPRSETSASRERGDAPSRETPKRRSERHR